MAAAFSIIRAADLKAVPWKNGGGATREIAASPPGAAFDAFDWRVSVAEVSVAGAFSMFEGIDRVARRWCLRMQTVRGTFSLAGIRSRSRAKRR
jgi:environmental stress-induced protein Ves